jgi:hypothetical protein
VPPPVARCALTDAADEAAYVSCPCGRCSS